MKTLKTILYWLWMIILAHVYLVGICAGIGAIIMVVDYLTSFEI